MPYFIAASPLVKIYLPEWHDRLLVDPELIFDDKTDFEFTVDTGARAIKVQFNQPMEVPGGNDPALFTWLTGGRNGELARDSDIYGIVEFNPQLNLVSTMDQLSALEDAISEDKDPEETKRRRQRLAEQRKATREKMLAARRRVRELADARIKRAVRITHNNLIKQWQNNEEMKMGKYPPSISEMLGTQAISQEIERSDAKTRAMRERFSELMNHTQA